MMRIWYTLNVPTPEEADKLLFDLILGENWNNPSNHMEDKHDSKKDQKGNSPQA